MADITKNDSNGNNSLRNVLVSVVRDDRTRNSKQGMDFLTGYVLALCQEGIGKPEGDRRNFVGNTFLIQEIKHQNRKEVQRLLTSKPNLELTAWAGCTALHEACSGESWEIVADLIAAGANVNAVNEYGYTPLMYASGVGDTPVATKINMILQLLTAGASINATNNVGENALHCAIESNEDVEIARLLVRRGIDVKAVTSASKWTPLHTCLYCKRNSKELIDELVQAGADLHAVDKQGKTPAQLIASSASS